MFEREIGPLPQKAVPGCKRYESTKDEQRGRRPALSGLKQHAQAMIGYLTSTLTLTLTLSLTPTLTDPTPTPSTGPNPSPNLAQSKMGAARNPAAGEDSDSDDEEKAIRLLHQHLFQYLEGRLDPRAQMSQLQSNMAGERAQNKAEKRKLVRPRPQPPWSPLPASVVSPPPLPCSSDGETRSTRAATPSLPSGCLRRAFTLVSRLAGAGERAAGAGERAGAQEAARRRAAAQARERQHAQDALSTACPL